MTETKIKETEAEVEDFADELSDEALDRAHVGGGKVSASSTLLTLSVITDR